MTHYVGLRYGDETIELSADPYILESYPVRAARPLPGGGYDFVDERISLTADGTDVTDAQENWNAIGRWLSVTAERKVVGEGEPLYIEIQPTGDPYMWRSELISGSMIPEDRALELWSNHCIKGKLEIRREPYFWGPLEAVPLTNRYLTGTETWIPIDNKEDASNDAHVDIDAADIGGELPSPAMITLINNDGSSQAYNAFYIAVNARSEPHTLIPFLEGEDLAGVAKTDVSYSPCSGGEYTRILLTGGNTKIWPRWTIPEATAEAFAGRFARVLVKLMQVTEDWVLQVQVLDMYNLVVLDEKRPRLVNSNEGGSIIDLGSIPIPPTAYTNDLAAQTLRIVMYHKGDAGDEGKIEIDYIALLPTDSGRTIDQRGMLIPSADQMIFDEIQGVWVSNEGGKKHPIYSPRGPGVMLFPSVDQRVFLLHDRGSTADQDDTKSIKISYRRRRLNL